MHATLEPSLKTDMHSTQLPIWRAVLFRFAFVYWMLIFMVLASNEDTGLIWFGKIVSPVWNPIAIGFGKHVLGIGYELNTAIYGSGDKTADWVGVLLAAIVAAVV